MTIAMLVPGGGGQLGSDLARLGASSDDIEVSAPKSSELDVRQARQVLAAVREFAAASEVAGRRPIVINAAAYTAVDDAESDEQRAFAVNVDGPRLLAAACATTKVPLVHISTDYVFAGDSERPYEPDDPVAPGSVYGTTKAAGEVAVRASGAEAWVVRTAWVYGAAGSNFVKTMARLERERETVSVVDDQHGSPTWSADLAAGLLELTSAIARGRGPRQTTLHCTGGGVTTWFSFARAVFSALGADPERVRPCTTDEFPRPARRPAHSVLSNASWAGAGLTPLRDWRDALTEFISTHRDAL